MSYTSVSISGYNANPPPDDGTTTADNEISWAKHKTKLTDPLKTAIESINTNVAAAITAVSNRMPTGSVIDYGGSTAPTGFLLCYGQAVSRTTYADLFTVIGTTFGSGDGSNTFNVPDCRGRVVAGQDDMGGTSADRLTDQTGGVDGDTLGDAGGSETHTLLDAEMPSHNHGGATGQQAQTLNNVSNVSTQAESGVATQVGAAVTQIVTAPQHSHTISSAGSDSPHNNVQPTIIMNKIIKI